jgi:hypothetical protein
MPEDQPQDMVDARPDQGRVSSPSRFRCAEIATETPCLRNSSASVHEH